MIAAGLFTASLSFGQVCTTYVDGPWINFNNLGGAPCSLTPPATTEITGFEIWGGEAYLMDNVKAGGQYKFSVCNSLAGPGTGGQQWDVRFTIVAPSGAVDASGIDSGSNCALSWTATETGEYTIVVYENGNCGVGVYVDNGYPAITYLGGASCDPPVTTCEAGTLNTTGTASSLCPGATTEFTVAGMIIPNSPTIGGAGVQFTPVNAGSTGGLGGVFVVTGYPVGDFAPYSVDNDIQGVLSFNGYPPLAGEWSLMPYVYNDQVDVFGKCDSTASVVVDFLSSGAPGCGAFVCEAGDITSVDQSVCPTEDASLTITGEQLPVPGAVLWFFLDTNDTSGANDLVVNFGSDPLFYNYVGDLNGLLAFNGIDTLSPSVYFTFAGIMHADTVCDVTDTGFFLTILDENDPQCGGVVPCVQPYPAPTNPQAVVSQSPAGVMLSWDPIPGSIGCQIKAGKVSGGGTATITVMGPDVSGKFISGSQMQAGTTYGFMVRCGCTTQVISPFSSAATWTYTNFLAPQPTRDVRILADERASGVSLQSSNILSSGVVTKGEASRATLDQLRNDLTAIGKLPAAKREVSTRSFEVFPNPSSGMVNVKYDAAAEGEISVRIHDVVGKVVFAKSIAVQGGSNLINLDLQSFEKGIYVMEINEGQKSSASKMVIK